MKATFFSILKDGTIFTVRETSKFLELNCSEIIEILGFTNHILSIRNNQFIKPLNLNSKPLLEYPQLILNQRPVSLLEIPLFLEIRTKEFENIITYFIQSDSTSNEKMSPIPINFNLNDIKNQSIDDLISLISTSFDLDHLNPQLFYNNNLINNDLNLLEILSEENISNLLFKFDLTEKSLNRIRWRKKVLLELITTEKNYIDDLNTMMNYYQPYLEKYHVLSDEDLNFLFKEIPSILVCHAHFLFNIQKRGAEYNSIISDCIIDFSSFFKVSKLYISNMSKYTEIVRNISSLPIMDNIIQFCPQENGGRNLLSFIITPVQRMPRYILLIRELLKSTPTSHIDYNGLKVACQKIDELTREFEKQSDTNEHNFTVYFIEKRLTRPVNLRDPPRAIINSSSIFFPKLSNCEGFIHLFKDMILITAFSKQQTETPLYISDHINVHYELTNINNYIKFGPESLLIEFVDPQKTRIWIQKFRELRNNFFKINNLYLNNIIWIEEFPIIPPLPLCYVNGCFIDNSIYFFGSTNNKENSNSKILIYEPNENKLNIIDILNFSIYGSKIIQYEQKIYLFGANSNDIYFFEPLNYKWNKIELFIKEILPENRKFHSLIEYNGYLILFGGINDSKILFNDIYLFIIKSNIWIKPKIIGNSPNPRYKHSSILYNNKMIIFGGRNELTIFNDLWIFDLSLSNWTEIKFKNLQIPSRCDHSTFIFNDQLYIIGGISQSKFINSNIIKINLKNFEVEFCQEIGNIPNNLYSFGLVNFENNIFLYGGINNLNEICNNILKLNIFKENLKNNNLPILKNIKNINQINFLNKINKKFNKNELLNELSISLINITKLNDFIITQKLRKLWYLLEKNNLLEENINNENKIIIQEYYYLFLIYEINNKKIIKLINKFLNFE